MGRRERLAALLDEPLLVAGPPYVPGGQANVRYLTGLASSNAAVLVEPDGSATLFTDSRYAPRAREVEGATVVETPRNLVAAIGEHLRGRRIGFEEQNLPHAGFRQLAAVGVEAVPRSGLVERLRAVKDAGEIEAMRRAGAVSDEVFGAATASGSRSTRPRCCDPSRRMCSSRATSCPSSRGSTSLGRRACGSKTSCS